MSYREDQDRFFADQGFEQHYRQIGRNRALLAKKLGVAQQQLMPRLRDRLRRWIGGDLVAINRRPLE